MRESKEELFEAVVICTGKESEPNISEFPGKEPAYDICNDKQDSWPGLQIHSHNYRTPERFENKVVVLIGNGPSAVDLLKEISPLAKQVHVAVRSSFPRLRVYNYDKALQHSMIECACKDGKVVFQDGAIVDADAIIHCTGYKYNYPFLKSNGIVSVDDNRVGPVYKHVFPPSLAPWLSFVGLTSKAVVFRVMELQARWVAKVLSGTVELPSQEAMSSSVEQLYSEMEKKGLPKNHTHSLMEAEVEYASWLAAQLNIKPLKRWKELTVVSIVKEVVQYGENFRDTWDIDKWMQEIDSSD
ncbi:hypothetical protein GQ457_06G032780 [Hibiscus cannabinus]